MFGTGIRFWFFWALLLPWCALARCGGDHALLCMVFVAAVLLCSVFFSSGSDDSRGRGEDTWIWSGSVAGLAGGSPGFFNPVRLVCFGAFFAAFFS